MKNEKSLHELIENYDFSELSIAQQQFILTEMSREEYTNMRKTIIETIIYFDEAPILMAEDIVSPKVKSNHLLLKFVNYKIPVYKIAALLVIVFSIQNLIPEEIPSNNQVSERTNEYIIDTDTFLSCSRYSSKNSIKYDQGLSRLVIN